MNMEWSLTTIIPHPIVLGVLTMVTLFYFMNVIWRRRFEVHPQIPPGSMGYYAIGETMHVMVKGFEFFQKKADKYGNIFKTHFIGRPTIRVAGGDNIREIFNGEEKIVIQSNPKTAMTLLGPYFLTSLRGTKHLHSRKDVLSSLRTERLEEYIPRVETMLAEYMNEWSKECKILACDKIQEVLFLTAWDIIIGLDMLEKSEAAYIHQKFKEFSKGLFTAPLNFPGFPYRKALKAKTILHNFIDKQISSGDDISKPSILQFMMAERLNSSDPYTREELKDMATGIIFAGHDTTSSAATSLLMCLSREKGVKEKVIEELKAKDLYDSEAVLTQPALNGLTYLNCVIKEVLRLYPPVGGAARLALKDFKLAGYHIPKDWAVTVAIKSTHAMSEVFEDREKFKPERWLVPGMSGNVDYNYVPFGADLRICVGKEYAKLVLRIFAILFVRGYSCKMLSDPVFSPLPALLPKDRMPVMFYKN